MSNDVFTPQMKRCTGKMFRYAVLDQFRAYVDHLRQPHGSSFTVMDLLQDIRAEIDPILGEHGLANAAACEGLTFLHPTNEESEHPPPPEACIGELFKDLRRMGDIEMLIHQLDEHQYEEVQEQIVNWHRESQALLQNRRYNDCELRFMTIWFQLQEPHKTNACVGGLYRAIRARIARLRLEHECQTHEITPACDNARRWRVIEDDYTKEYKEHCHPEQAEMLEAMGLESLSALHTRVLEAHSAASSGPVLDVDTRRAPPFDRPPRDRGDVPRRPGPPPEIPPMTEEEMRVQREEWKRKRASREVTSVLWGDTKRKAEASIKLLEKEKLTKEEAELVRKFIEEDKNDE